MSNPTELPDLLQCPFCGNGDIDIHPNDLASCGREMSNPHTDANYAHCDGCGMDGPVGMTDLEARELWNRRAQPEGEAPQAVKQYRLTIAGSPWYDMTKAVEETLPNPCEGYEFRTLYTAPAAQHAESGALINSRDRFDAHFMKTRGLLEAPTRHGAGYINGYAQEAWMDWQSALAAQFQDTGLLKLALEQAKSRIAQADARIEELEAAQSQGAQAMRTLEIERDAARSAVKEYRARIERLEVSLAALAPVEAPAAQQAAAPGAVDDLLPPLGIRNDRDMLNYLMTAFDNEIANCERCGHAEPTKNMDSASFLRDYLAASSSAPGTPEAPRKTGQQLYAAWQQSQADSAVYAPWYRLDDETKAEWNARAAQLDGGQGEG